MRRAAADVAINIISRVKTRTMDRDPILVNWPRLLSILVFINPTIITVCDEALFAPAIHERSKPHRIDKIHWIAADIIIPVHPVRIADGIGLHESPERRRVDARLVVPHPHLGQPRLPGVTEPPDVGRRGDAIFVVGVDIDRRAGAVGDAEDTAALVGHQEPARGAADRAALVPDDRVVDTGAMDIAAPHGIAAIIFADQVDAIVEEPRRHPAANGLIEPPERIIAERRA